MMDQMLHRLADQVIGSLTRQADGPVRTAELLLFKFAQDPSQANRAELSDWGIRTFRAECQKRGYDRPIQEAIVRGEVPRVRHLTADERGLKAYIEMSRAGMEHPMTRSMRVGLFCQFAANNIMRPGSHPRVALGEGG